MKIIFASSDPPPPRTIYNISREFSTPANRIAVSRTIFVCAQSTAMMRGENEENEKILVRFSFSWQLSGSPSCAPHQLRSTYVASCS